MTSNRRGSKLDSADLPKAQGSSPNSPRQRTGAIRVYHQLRESILNLKLSPGVILDESELAKEFELSRSPVREALVRLSTEGLIRTLPNRSAIVAPFDLASVPTFLDALELAYRVTSHLAAANCLDEQVAKIEEIEARLEQARKAREFSQLIGINREFHLAVAEAGGNEYFTHWLQQVLDQGQRLLRLCVYFGGDKTPRSALGAHAEIIKALKTRDCARAEQAGQRDANYLRSEFLHAFENGSASKIVLN